MLYFVHGELPTLRIYYTDNTTRTSCEIDRLSPSVLSRDKLPMPPVHTSYRNSIHKINTDFWASMDTPRNFKCKNTIYSS